MTGFFRLPFVNKMCVKLLLLQIPWSTKIKNKTILLRGFLVLTDFLWDAQSFQMTARRWRVCWTSRCNIIASYTLYSATSLSYLLVVLLSVWQVDALPIWAIKGLHRAGQRQQNSEVFLIYSCFLTFAVLKGTAWRDGSGLKVSGCQSKAFN